MWSHCGNLSALKLGKSTNKSDNIIKLITELDLKDSWLYEIIFL